ncbi:hypothetical protein EGR_04512 [Echinococcus granulosus]|uniref:RRM domain-containing protein n=1 Tax=Echinococcus granulosus TaxID=6210 RepID=W6V3Q9_ECHGR|nr:hypothetical protein EGR_04512 [Echinococcus granulosus]EUB60679.1 hypothetical protein EGR_04512 [Echinococcus granulosus]
MDNLLSCIMAASVLYIKGLTNNCDCIYKDATKNCALAFFLKVNGSVGKFLALLLDGTFSGVREDLLSVGGKKANPNDPNTLRELVINNLPRQITHDNIRDYFKEFGAVTKVRVDRQMHQAFVTFSTAEAHRIAMATAKIHRESRNVRVSFPDDCKQSMNNQALTLDLFSYFTEHSSIFDVRHSVFGMRYLRDSKSPPLPPLHSDPCDGESNRLLPICSKEVGSNDTKTSHRVLLDNLPPWTTENDIRSLFGKFGVSAKVEVDEQTRLALATFPSADTLYDAMSAAPFRLKGVNLHTYFHEDSVWSKDARRNCTTTGYLVLLGHLPPRTTENDIRSLFGKFGASAKVEVDERKHVALATFSSLGTLHEALSPEVLSLKGENLIFINEGDYGWSKEVDSNDTESSFQVLLHDLQPGTTENGLRSLMGRFGVSTKVVVDERKHEALATFSSEKAIQAVWMDYFLFKGVNLGISFPEDSEESVLLMGLISCAFPLSDVQSPVFNFQAVVCGPPTHSVCSSESIQQLCLLSPHSVTCVLWKEIREIEFSTSASRLEPSVKNYRLPLDISPPSRNIVPLSMFGMRHSRDSKQLLLLLPHSDPYMVESNRTLSICSKEKYFNPDEIRRQLILDGLPPRTTENDIRSLFGKFGVSIKVELYGWTRRALVTFSSAKARQEAVSSAPLRLKGVDLHILYPED